MTLALITIITAKTTSKTAKTTIWRTGTNSDGITVTTQDIFTPTFISIYGTGDAESVPAGTIGIGSINGEVGKIRSYTKMTITSDSDAQSLKSILSASDRGMGFLSSVLISLLSAFGLLIMFVF